VTASTDNAPRNAVVIIGNFDGVHLGHQAVLAAVSRLSRQRGLQPTLLTFQPHPAVTLGRAAPALLTTLDRKLELIERACPSIRVVVREFTTEFAQQSPEQFVERVLVEELHTSVVMVGMNFRFGHRRSGSFGDLERFGAAHGFEAIAEPLVSDSEGPWSSTRVRERIATGDLSGAQAILGRPHMLSGEVVQGDQRGRQIGFPTCNIAVVPEALPPNGVYATVVDQVDRSTGKAVALATGVANLGLRPTVGDGKLAPLLEVHLFDVDRDLYGEQLRVHLVDRIRPERRFPSFDALKQQIGLDAEGARSTLAPWEPDPVADGAWC
jgi:riboflavin kinase/FMN adenylyltransferase